MTTSSVSTGKAMPWEQVQWLTVKELILYSRSEPDTGRPGKMPMAVEDTPGLRKSSS